MSRDPDAMAGHAKSFHFLLNAIPVGHHLNPYTALLKLDGVMALVDALTVLKPPLQGHSLIGGHRRVACSVIAGMAETKK